jgi:prepilin-type N-terminal cleavage/methylation domain-containing protein
MKRSLSKHGFTLVEIMIVVAIIGMLTALAIPNILKAGKSTRRSRFAREIQTAGHAFLQYSLENGKYPGDKTPAQMPEGMSEYLRKFPWSKDTVIGGKWDWDFEQFGVKAGVSVKSPHWEDEQMLEVDEMMDDGNLGSGHFRKRSGGYIYIIEE